MLKNAIRAMLAAAGKNGSSVSRELHITRSAFTQYLNGDFMQVKKLIKIADLCNCEIVIRNKSGLEIKLQADPEENTEK